jgi:putative transcriptional regulator
MTIRHHPEDSLLTAYAAGALDSAMSLIVGTHLSFCARCRDTVGLYEQVGGILLEDVAPIPMAEEALTKIMGRLDQPVPGALPPSNDNTPAPLRAFLGRDLSQVAWRRMGPNLAYHTLVRRGPLAVRLLRGAPGTDTGRHSHHGLEYTLVLRGGFTDETGSYAPGDFQCASPEVSHNPVADPGEDCINLAVTTAPLRFENLAQKVVGRLFGF